MKPGTVAATRFCIIVIMMMFFIIASGTTLYAKQDDVEGDPQITEKQKKDHQNNGFDHAVEKFIEHGFTPPEHVSNPLFDYYREVTEIKLFEMVSVGEVGVQYQVPICSNFCGYWETNDDATAYVMGGYKMTITEVTYELWYTIRIWALDQGYQFQNPGTEGSLGIPGAEPTEQMKQPVTTISFRDMVVWLNALSEYYAYDPVYRNASGSIIKNATNANAYEVDQAIQTDYIGYRLPTGDEWSMAAKWKDDSESIDGSIYRGGRYWTPHNYLSGSTAPYTDMVASNEVAWHIGNSGGYSHLVGLLKPNALGIYDMSGNSWETTFSPLYAGRQNRGGGWDHPTTHSQVGVSRYWGYPDGAYNNGGFRFVINE